MPSVLTVWTTFELSVTTIVAPEIGRLVTLSLTRPVSVLADRLKSWVFAPATMVGLTVAVV